MTKQNTNVMTRLIAPVLCAGGLLLGVSSSIAEAGGSALGVPVDANETRIIELAICLDTSGSMDGLIDAAKQKLWAIVNDLALADPTPRLRVALLTFGNDGHAADEGWVATQTAFTEDLDLVSQKLFALRTNGGTELVGRVLRSAGTLDWHPSEGTLKLIVVAGNESADQDQEVKFREVCPKLIKNGILVNSIYCGPLGDELAADWRQVALLADGHFASIDKDQGTVVIATPFDDRLAEISGLVNATYLPFGAEGEAGASNQWAQDENAANLNSAAAAQRCSTKTSELYTCAWDLVDACGAKTVKIEDVKVEDLPESMRAMTLEERVAHVVAMGEKRAEHQREAKELTARRAMFIEGEMKRMALDDSKSFDRVVRTAIRAQAAAKGFRFREDMTAALKKTDPSAEKTESP